MQSVTELLFGHGIWEIQTLNTSAQEIVGGDHVFSGGGAQPHIDNPAVWTPVALFCGSAFFALPSKMLHRWGIKPFQVVAHGDRATITSKTLK